MTVPSTVESLLDTLIGGFEAVMTTLITGGFDALAFIFFSLTPSLLFAFFLALILYGIHQKYLGGYT